MKQRIGLVPTEIQRILKENPDAVKGVPKLQRMFLETLIELDERERTKPSAGQGSTGRLKSSAQNG